MTGRRKPRYLFVVPSTCQMYSGTGRAIFDWIRFAKDTFEFSMLIDTDQVSNWAIAKEFCREHHIIFLSATPWLMPGCCDVLLKETADLLISDEYDIVECVSWANAATNMQVLSSLPGRTVLVYTPHTQPIWTLSESANIVCIEPVFKKMLRRSDAIFLDSAAEARLPAFHGQDADNHFIVPLGVDTNYFKAGGEREANMVLCVCDFRERRKRVDLLLESFRIACARNPSLKLHLAGKGSDFCEVPTSIATNVVRHGYVTAEQLLHLYRTASVFVLMSDFEAFGLPIAEALCCGTQVLINRQDALVDLFDELPGVHWTVNSEIGKTADILISLFKTPVNRQKIRSAAVRKFSLQNTYGRKLAHVSAVLENKLGAYP